MTIHFAPEWSLRWAAPQQREHLDVVLSSVALLMLATVGRPLLEGGAYLLARPHAWTHAGGAFICPLCGGTRSFVAMSHGDVAGALSQNVFAVLLWVWCVAQIPIRLIALFCQPSRVVRDAFARIESLGARMLLPAVFTCWLLRAVTTGVYVDV